MIKVGPGYRCLTALRALLAQLLVASGCRTAHLHLPVVGSVLTLQLNSAPKGANFWYSQSSSVSARQDTGQDLLSRREDMLAGTS